MTGRGPRGNPPLRFPSSIDPTLESRPAPHEHRFPIRSFAPGAAADVQQTVTSSEELERVVEEASVPETGESIDNSDLLRYVTKYEMSCSDPTWGFYLFLTDYSETTKDKMPRAIDNLTKAMQQVLGASVERAHPLCVETYKRLKFDLVEDQEALEGASMDRVRACFRALLRSMHLSDDEEYPFPLPVRNRACLVLDRATVDMLADLPFSEGRTQESGSWGKRKIRAVDIDWERSEMSRSAYRGVREFAIEDLSGMYMLLHYRGMETAEL
jgi:hypothetical protein